MATKIVTKNSSTASAAPTASDLVQGELAVNVVDKRLYTEDNAGNIVELGTNPLGEITANGGIALGDGDVATFNSNLSIFSSGTTSYIQEAGAGDLYLKASSLYITDRDNNQFMSLVDNGTGGTVSLMHNTATKLATTSTGIDVTGISVSDGMSTNTLGTSNFVAGVNAGNSIESGGNYNTVVGDEAGTAITTGDQNVAIGYAALDANTTASNNTAVGYSALTANTTGYQNTVVGALAGDALTTGNNNTSLGFSSLSADTLGDRSVAIGGNALKAQNFTSTTDSYNTAVGYNAGLSVTTGTSNTLIGGLAGDAITTGTNNVALGANALAANTSASNNVALGASAGYSNATGTSNVFLGNGAGYSTTGSGNTFVGGSTSGAYYPAGYLVTSGANNTIIGGYNGNEGGLDIRTTNNNIVLSDGDGNPRGIFNSSGNFLVGRSVATTTSKIQSEEGITIYYPTTNSYWDIYRSSDNTLRFVDGSVSAYLSTGGAWTNASDARLKKDIVESVHGLASVLASSPRSYQFRHIDGPQVGFIAQELQAVIPEVVEGAEDGAEMMGINYGALTAVAFKAIQEQQTLIESLTARIVALEE